MLRIKRIFHPTHYFYPVLFLFPAAIFSFLAELFVFFVYISLFFFSLPYMFYLYHLVKNNERTMRMYYLKFSIFSFILSITTWGKIFNDFLSVTIPLPFIFFALFIETRPTKEEKKAKKVISSFLPEEYRLKRLTERTTPQHELDVFIIEELSSKKNLVFSVMKSNHIFYISHHPPVAQPDEDYTDIKSSIEQYTKQLLNKNSNDRLLLVTGEYKFEYVYLDVDIL